MIYHFFLPLSNNNGHSVVLISEVDACNLIIPCHIHKTQVTSVPSEVVRRLRKYTWQAKVLRAIPGYQTLYKSERSAELRADVHVGED